MIWRYLLSGVLFIVTVAWGSYGIIMPLIVLRFANPLIRHLESKGMIDGKAARKRNRFTILLWLVMDIIAIAVISIIGNRYVWIGVAIGLVCTLLFGLGKTGKNANNKQDFIRSYANYFTAEPESVVSEIVYF